MPIFFVWTVCALVAFVGIGYFLLPPHSAGTHIILGSAFAAFFSTIGQLLPLVLVPLGPKNSPADDSLLSYVFIAAFISLYLIGLFGGAALGIGLGSRLAMYLNLLLGWQKRIDGRPLDAFGWATFWANRLIQWRSRLADAWRTSRA